MKKRGQGSIMTRYGRFASKAGSAASLNSLTTPPSSSLDLAAALCETTSPNTSETNSLSMPRDMRKLPTETELSTHPEEHCDIQTRVPSRFSLLVSVSTKNIGNAASSTAPHQMPFKSVNIQKRGSWKQGGYSSLSTQVAEEEGRQGRELSRVAAEPQTAMPKSPPEVVSPMKKDLRVLATIAFCRLNVLLVFVPIGLLAEPYGEPYGITSAYVFVFNFIAIVPLASILGAATESLAEHTGQLVGGLLNATFGNAVEMIMCVQAVRAGLIQVVQGNLLGSILSNLLLVLGMAIVASGSQRKQTLFNAEGASANMTCQILASISIALPTMYRNIHGAREEDILALSRVCSVFLMFTYCLFLVFQLKTHADLFMDDAAEEGEAAEPVEDLLSATSSVCLLGFITLVVAACSENLVGSIEAVSGDFGLPKAFIGVILLPIVGNAAEHATAVTCAYKGMMDLALGVAVGSSTQIALFVVPCSVLCGWFFNNPMTLDFRNFDAACMLLSVFLTAQVLQLGNSNWLHGAMLMATYLFIAIITWFIPETN